MTINWKDEEFHWCVNMVRNHGAPTSNPKAASTYLRIQAASAFRAGKMEISARLAHAATCINEDARNDHEPNWDEALKALAAETEAHYDQD